MIGEDKMADRKDKDLLPPVHPGEILGEEIETRGVSAGQLARDIDVPANRISEIIAGRRSISPDTAFRLGLYLGTSAKFWLDLQSQYDLETLNRAQGEAIKARVRPHAA
jgi:addiction module HigA family antidote